ncbi:MAG: hypothetical protein IJ261_01650 [Clostridia bacterium]|nr:hypothetical protein [Clostridia bacterium]
MKVALVNFSPRGEKSNSRIFENYVKQHLDESLQTVELNVANVRFDENDFSVLNECNCWIFFYPLYIDSLPSHMLSFIAKLENDVTFSCDKRLYAVANCGFYEGIQTRLSFEILDNWCSKSGINWCGGVGIGGSGCFEIFERFRVYAGPRIPVNRALGFLADNVASASVQCNDYVTVALPKRFYRAAGQILWRQKIAENGGRSKDLFRIP